MAVLPILELPHPALRQRARKVRKIGSSTLRLAQDMVDTMREAGGVGLAANQVGALRRLIVIQLPEEEEASIYINPEIVHREGEREVEEGCLSIPGYKGLITRSVWVRFRALDETSKLVRLKAEDLLSQALEHEIDHLNGILYIDHLESHQQLIPVTAEIDPQADDQETDGRSSSPGQDDHAGQVKTLGELVMPVSDSDSRETPASLKIR